MNDEQSKAPEYKFDLNNVPKVMHHWVDRGEVMSCEGAGHPAHRHFKVRVSEVVS